MIGARHMLSRCVLAYSLTLRSYHNRTLNPSLLSREGLPENRVFGFPFLVYGERGWGIGVYNVQLRNVSYSLIPSRRIGDS